MQCSKRSDEQKFVFDLKGWIAIPGVLTPQETNTIRGHIIALREDPESLDPLDRYSLSGPSQILLDHPIVVGVLREILGGDRSESCYGFRCENSFPVVRSTDYMGLDPHGGGAGVGIFGYNCVNGRIFSGLTRVVWELNPVDKGDGGTLFMSGSHKANFGVHASHMRIDSPMFDTYECPPGSVVIFSEGGLSRRPEMDKRRAQADIGVQLLRPRRGPVPQAQSANGGGRSDASTAPDPVPRRVVPRLQSRTAERLFRR